MKNIIVAAFFLGIFFGIASFHQNSSADLENSYFLFPNNKLYGTAIPVCGNWTIDGGSTSFGNKNTPSIEKIPARSYFADSGDLQKTNSEISCGASLDLKYFSGISYDFLRTHLCGKTVSIRIFVPEESISPNNVIPNRVRFGVKSVKDDQWTAYFGGKDWTAVNKEGFYEFSFTIPEEPTISPGSSGDTFYPGYSRLFFVDFYSIEGTKYSPRVMFFISDFKIEDIDLDNKKLQWERTINGYTVQNAYLPSFDAESTYLEAINKTINIEFTPGTITETALGKISRKYPEDFFLSVPVYIPKELQYQDGRLKLTLHGLSGEDVSGTKDFSSCDPAGRLFLTLHLGKMNDPVKLIRGIKLNLNITTRNPHTTDMMPFVIEPVRIVRGELIPFDKNWALRDVQGSQKYLELPVLPEGQKSDLNTVTVDALGKDLYQTMVTVPLKGGIVWSSPFYRAELVRPFEEPVDLTNKHVQLLMSPITDTTSMWQKPYRARIGLLDINDRVMSGTNVSLSEGVPHLAYLDVSIDNPIPKGFVMPGFDPGKIKAVFIDFESSPAPAELTDIRVSLSDLSISDMKYPKAVPVGKFDFSVFKRDPSLWQITEMLNRSKEPILGINYPFPTINVPKDLLEVPQVYPTVGRKITDPAHFGFSSSITKDQTLNDFKKFSSDNINIVRIFTLGDLDGIFTWDQNKWDIAGFSPDSETLLKKMSLMNIKDFTEFLNKNEKTIFGEGSDPTIPGLNEYVLGDFTALLDILEQVETETGNRVTVILSLFDFLLGDGISQQGPYLVYSVGEYPQVATDPVVRAKVQAITWKLIKTLNKDKRFSKYVVMTEIMNEPANACVLSTKEYFNSLINFVGNGLYLLKDALGPSIPVGVGFRSWPEDLKFWSDISGGLDLLTIHYWESLESYDINVPGMWPLNMPVEKLWEELGTKQEGRPTGMTEIAPSGDLRSNLEEMMKAGYDFYLIWSYSGHDGFDAKPLLGEMKEYQSENHK